MGKKLIFLLLGVCFLLLWGGNVSGKFDSSSEKIKNFFVKITINKDSSFLVKEEITYDFGENYKHGIYRNIPVRKTKIVVIKVTDELGNPYRFRVTKEGNYLQIKIGDPNKVIKGEHTYNIFYRVWKEIRFFQNHDELYWNITGNEWEVPIERSGAIVSLPEKIPERNLRFACFTGFVGSQVSDCNFRLKENGEILFESQKSFLPREGLTIVLGWPKGVVQKPSLVQKIFWDFEDFWPLLIPVFVFNFLFNKWWREGKDPKIKKTIVAQYEPPDDLRPAEVGLILNQRITGKEITATLVDLAVRGYIKIKEIPRNDIFEKVDYELINLKDFNDPQEELREYEREILNKIFDSKDRVLISNLKNKFRYHLLSIIEKIYSGITKFEYFVSEPQKIQRRLTGIGVGVTALGFVFGIFFRNYILLISVFLSGILFLIFAPFMPKRTSKGIEAYWQILGFKEYINTAEKYRLQFQERENIFEEFLPYAIIFGLVEKWLRAFEGIYRIHPQWYEGSYHGAFSFQEFFRSFNPLLNSMNNIFRESGFDGKGFSGGGSGGGGGKSW